jgi:hypothetical protein
VPGSLLASTRCVKCQERQTAKLWLAYGQKAPNICSALDYRLRAKFMPFDPPLADTWRFPPAKKESHCNTHPCHPLTYSGPTHCATLLHCYSYPLHSLLASSAQRRTAEKPSDWPSNTLPRKLISVLPESGLNRIIDFTATTALRATRGLPAYASRSTRISTTKHATCPLKDIACTKPSKNQLP